MAILRKKINLILLISILILFGYYIYQTISISSGNVSLVELKKEFLEKKNNLASINSQIKNHSLEPSSIKENLGMSEIEKFDYIILGPSEFALVKEDENIRQ